MSVTTAPAAPTVQQLLTLAMQAAGVVDAYNAPQQADLSMALSVFNAMISQWNQSRLLVPNLVDVACMSTGEVAYTVGPGKQFDMPRPDRIVSAFARMITAASQETAPGTFSSEFDGAEFSVPVQGNIQQPLAIDFPLGIIQSREDWNSISLKGLTTFPSSLWYDSDALAPMIHLWPVPTANRFEIHVSVKAALSAGVALTDAIATPSEYWEAMQWNMAGRLRPFFGMGPEPTITQLARGTLSTIRASNTQIPTLDLPAVVQGRGSLGGVGFIAVSGNSSIGAGPT